MGQYVTAERDGALATVTIDQPEKLHALNSDVMAELSAVRDDMVDDGTVVTVILRSTGDTAFVAGESAEFAFPEVTRGLIPGATYGAQWLPRLVGLSKPIELIAGANPSPHARRAPEPDQSRRGRRRRRRRGGGPGRDAVEQCTAPRPRRQRRVCRRRARTRPLDGARIRYRGHDPVVRNGGRGGGIRAFVDGDEPTFEGR